MPGNRGKPAAAIGEGADARQHHAVGRAHHGGVGGHHDVGGDAGFARRALERLGGGSQIARAVIDDGDVIHGELALRACPWSRAPASAWRGSIATAWRKRPRQALEAGFDDMVVVLAIEGLDMEGAPRPIGRMPGTTP